MRRCLAKHIKRGMIITWFQPDGQQEYLNAESFDHHHTINHCFSWMLLIPARTRTDGITHTPTPVNDRRAYGYAYRSPAYQYANPYHITYAYSKPHPGLPGGGLRSCRVP